MKPYEYIKTKDERISKIFGYPIYSQKFGPFLRYQYFFNGFISTYKTSDEQGLYVEKDIKIFNKSILKRINNNDEQSWYFDNKCFHRKSIKEDFAKICFKKAKSQYDKIYILNANSGETYLFLTYILNVLINKYGIKSILLVAKRKYQADLAKMICPDVKCILISRNKINSLNFDSFSYNNSKFFMLFASLYFKKVEDDIKYNPLGTKHYFQSILEKMNISEDELIYQKIKVPDSVEKTLMKKIKKINLNLEKFVFISPEAKSCSNIEVEFWTNLISDIKAKGYDIFVNIAEKNIDIPIKNNYKTCFLTFSEAFYLASLSKRIISLRSGFTEVLLQTNVPIDVLYTGYKDRPYFGELTVEQVMSGFAVNKLPNINDFDITEYNAEKDDLTHISASIIQKL